MKTVIGEAPGRLDFLGGVADYSGSLVLEMPLRLTTRVTLSGHAAKEFVFVSAQEGRFVVAPGTPPAAVPKWVRYSYGCLLLFCRAQRWQPKAGLKFSIRSRVPTSMGVSSSAALEVATLRALEKFSGRKSPLICGYRSRKHSRSLSWPTSLMLFICALSIFRNFRFSS